jgi:predicted PurR-regulated permease PerM
MKELYEQYKLFFLIVIVAAVVFLVWYFAPIVICVLIAGVVMIIGLPLVDLLDRIRYRKFSLPRPLRVSITLLLMVSLFIGLLAFIVPLIVKEANMLASIDTKKLMSYFQSEIDRIQDFLIRFGILAQDETLVNTLKNGLIRVMNVGMISDLVTNIFTIAGNLFFYFFTVLFLSFFFLMKPDMLPNFVILLLPSRNEQKVLNILHSSKKLLSRYFIGLIAEVTALSLLVSLGLMLIGVEGAFPIGFFAGVMNIVPYLGYFIASTLGVLLAITGALSAGDYAAILPITIKTIAVMVIANMIDNSVLQPFFFGKSVNASPVEIFLVIIAAGFIGGILGMIVAVPAYTFIRIVAREFLGESRMVRKLTDKM